MAGRREMPVDPEAGPVQRFASELRALRARTGGITYRSLARRAGYSVTTLSQAAAGEQLPTLPVALAYAEACGGDLAEWEARWKAAVEEVAGDVSRAEEETPAPYRGLARFETGDTDLFFGREQLTADLVDLLRRRRFAALFGPSGSGKSSLLRAGLIPVLRNVEKPDRRPATIRILTPGEHPARSHAALLTPVAVRDGGKGDDDADTFVIVDQFEEVFTLCHDAAERARFIDLLLTARHPGSRLRVLLAVRGDFYGRCAEHRGLAEALRDANLLAGAMSQAELRQAVVKPAATAGLTVERALTARLVEEVADAPGGLPLLSHALLETWRRRRGKTLTMAGYEAAGGLDGAIGKTAEEVYGRFTEQQTVAARRVLLRLVAPGDGTPDTRRPVRRADLPGRGGDDTDPVVEALAAARLLTLDGDTVEMAHEALITAWPRLRGWIEEDRERLRAHRALTEAAHTWQELGREEGALSRGSRLAAAQEHFGGAARAELTDLETAFLDASRYHEHRGRRRYRLVLTTVVAALCLALVAAGLAVGQWHSAVGAQHVAESRQLAAQSGALLGSDPDLAALLAVRAYRTSPTREATAALYAAAALPLRKRLTGGPGPVDSLALSPDGHTLATHSTDDKVRIWELPAGRLRHTFAGRGVGEVLAFSPDGRSLAVYTTNDGGGVALWDPDTGRETRSFAVPDGYVRSLAFSPDGRRVTIASSSVRMWDVPTGRMRHRFTGLRDPQAVVFGPRGRTVAAADAGGQVRVWDTGTGRVRSTHGGKNEGVTLRFSPDRRTYAVVRTDGSVQLHETATGLLRHTFKDTEAVRDDVTFSPDGRTLAVPGSDGTVRLWDTVSGTARTPVPAGHRGGGATRLALGADGRTLVTSSIRDPDVRVQRLPDDHPRSTLRGPSGTFIASTAFSQDGHAVATMWEGPTTGRAQLWDVRTGEPSPVLPLDGDPALREVKLSVPITRLGAVAFSPSGSALAATMSRDRTIEVRDVATGGIRHSRSLGVAHRALFGRDGTRLAVVGWDGTARIWDLATGALHTARTGRSGPVRAAAFTADGRMLAIVKIGADDKEVTVFDTASGRAQRTIKTGGSLLSLAFSPDERTLVTIGNRSVKTWDTRTGQLRNSFTTETEVQSPSFSPDGRTLAVTSVVGVQLWDLATGQIRITVPTRSPATVMFSPDGRTLAIGTHGSVELWTVDLPDPAHAIRTICRAVDATLSPAQQSRYLHEQSAQNDCRPAASQK
ncbi:helix-turn-helix domain-containing protein [Streptomyces griseorubiginosus]|uniref:nSTAND1 domain-containing NTPase n=1 Tax=Streptomyces griseorubiginosus TaxID=67304 RepID=UPI0036EFDA52